MHADGERHLDVGGAARAGHEAGIASTRSSGDLAEQGGRAIEAGDDVRRGDEDDAVQGHQAGGAIGQLPLVEQDGAGLGDRAGRDREADRLIPRVARFQDDLRGDARIAKGRNPETILRGLVRYERRVIR